MCRSALELACNTEQREGALKCIQGAIAERSTLDYIDSHIRLLDHYLECNWCDDASTIKSELEKNVPDLSCQENDRVCTARKEQLQTYINTELTKRPRLSEKQHSMSRWFNRRSRGLDLCPTPTIALWLIMILRALKWVFLVALIVPLIFLGVYLLRYWWHARELNDKCWIVWSITDDSKCGAAGAVMDALSFRSNPLLARFLSDDLEQRKRERTRREILLAPPFFVPDKKKLSPTLLVWVDLLEPAAPINREAFIEEIPFNCDTIPRFILDAAYEEIDISVGGFGVKGVTGVIRSLKRFRDRKLQSVIGVVSKSGAEGQPPTWAVRLNANKPGIEVEDKTISVYADSTPMSFGDPLGQVAERAAFKLVIRIVRPDLDAHDVTAIATFRQGMELLLQLL